MLQHKFLTVPVGVFQGVIDVLQHDVLNEHMSWVRLVYPAGEVVLQSCHQSVQRPLAVDRYDLLPDLQHWIHPETPGCQPHDRRCCCGD